MALTRGGRRHRILARATRRYLRRRLAWREAYRDPQAVRLVTEARELLGRLTEPRLR